MGAGHYGPRRGLTVGVNVPRYDGIERSGRGSRGVGPAGRGPALPARHSAIHRRPARARRAVRRLRALGVRARDASTGIDTSAAAAAPGVVGVYTAADLDLQPFGPRPAGRPPEAMRRPVMATDVVRFVGELVAVVVAETRAHAVDAAELVEVDYDPLDVVDRHRPRRSTTTRRSCSTSGNLAAEGPVRRGRAGRRRGRRRRALRQPAARRRADGAERRLAAPDPERRRRRSCSGRPARAPHAHRDRSRVARARAPSKLRVISPATGGGFGARIARYPEQVVVVALARELGGPSATSRPARRRCSRCTTAGRRSRTSRSAARATAAHRA